MDGKDPSCGVGLHCCVTGTVVGEPMLKMVKNGTVPMLGMTVSFPEYDGAKSACRVTLFGKQAQAFADKVSRGQRLTVEGTIRLNSWEKNGETKHGLSMLASKIEVAGGVSSRRGYAGPGGNGSRRALSAAYDDDADLF